MARKTIEVGKLLHMGNFFLAGKNNTPDERQAICSMIESMLQQTGNYQGYRYLDTAEIEGNGTRRAYFASSLIDDDYDAAHAESQRAIGAVKGE